MNKADEKKPVFPAGYEHVEESLDDTIQHVQQLEDQINNIPKEQGPTIKYNPPYSIGRVVPGTRDRTRLFLKDRQHEIKMDTLSKTEDATRDTDGQTGRVVRDTVREKLFPNPYRQVSREERLDDRDALKDIEQSQDYMDAELVERATKRKDAPKPEKPAKSEMSMSARYSLSLGYTKARENIEKSPAPVRDRQQDKDRD
ncbi:hypothetical protein [Spirosoma pollinicola]|uniref:Uncharacterized protein n=1 Tax=Spirosoma pollinicola TaxID=2057025 RepID=A0A2K8YX42_9BACT|nr:hypothetical protein [Spirosoma pollinicola]AUD02169.1 hypothetical protein CWM47_10260 [Spirosoma pollinicola]